MQKTFKLIIALGTILFFLRLSSYVIPEFFCVLLSLIVLGLLVVLLIGAVVRGATRWREFSRFWPAPAIVCIAFISSSFYVPPPMGRYISDRVFEKHLNEYSKIADAFRYGEVRCAISCSGNIELIETTNLPVHVGSIRGTHCDGNGWLSCFELILMCHYFMKAIYSGTSQETVIAANCLIRAMG